MQKEYYMANQKLKILKVTFEDITEMPGWHPADGHEEQHIQPVQCVQVGFKVKEDKKNLYMSPMFGGSMNQDGSNSWGSLMVIPKGCIRKIEKLG